MSIHIVGSGFVLRRSNIQRTPKGTCRIVKGQNCAIFFEVTHSHAIDQRFVIRYLLEHSLGPVPVCNGRAALCVILFKGFWKRKKYPTKLKILN